MQSQVTKKLTAVTKMLMAENYFRRKTNTHHKLYLSFLIDQFPFTHKTLINTGLTKAKTH